MCIFSLKRPGQILTNSVFHTPSRFPKHILIRFILREPENIQTNKSNACPDATIKHSECSKCPLMAWRENYSPLLLSKEHFGKRMCLQQNPLLMSKPQWWLDKWKLPLVKAFLLSENLIKWVSLYTPLNPGWQTLLILNPQLNTRF